MTGNLYIQYSKNYDFETFPLPSRYSYSVPWLTVGHRYPPLPYRPTPLHDRPSPSLTVPHRSSPSLTVPDCPLPLLLKNSETTILVNGKIKYNFDIILKYNFLCFFFKEIIKINDWIGVILCITNCLIYNTKKTIAITSML